MNRRLLLIAENIENGKGLIDVGTDHGYLPVYMAQKDYCGNIFASDINADPLNKAIRHARESGLDGRINFMLSDGLHDCPQDAVDTVVIAGMGGDMIVKILDEVEWVLSNDYKLILQPMSKAEILRYWLVYNGFEILREQLVDENNTVYQVIVARFGGITKLNDAELYIGKRELSENTELYAKIFMQAKNRFKRAVAEISGGESIPAARLGLFEEIYHQLENMENA